MQPSCRVARISPTDAEVLRRGAEEGSRDANIAIFLDGEGLLVHYAEASVERPDEALHEWLAARGITPESTPSALPIAFGLEPQLGIPRGSASTRVCFTLAVNPERLDEYRARHAAVWPEMLAAIWDAGNRNYSIFVGEDGLLVGYLETEDFAAAQESLSRSEAANRWENEMAAFFVQLDGGRPDEAKAPLRELSTSTA